MTNHHPPPYLKSVDSTILAKLVQKKRRHPKLSRVYTIFVFKVCKVCPFCWVDGGQREGGCQSWADHRLNSWTRTLQLPGQNQTQQLDKDTMVDTDYRLNSWTRTLQLLPRQNQTQQLDKDTMVDTDISQTQQLDKDTRVDTDPPQTKQLDKDTGVDTDPQQT